MDTELIYKYEEELANSDPITVHGVTLYPVLWKDRKLYASFVQCLTYNPIYYQDAALSSLPRLYFITSIVTDASPQKDPLRSILITQLQGILQLVLREQRFELTEMPSKQIGLKVFTDAGEVVVINAKKFDEIRRVILLQNDTYCEERYIHPDILRWIETQKENERKHTSEKYIETSEDKKEVLMMIMHSTDEHLLDNMSIRRVNRLHEKELNRQVFEAQLNGSMSGFVQFKESPVSWAVTRPKQSDFDKYLQELKPR